MPRCTLFFNLHAIPVCHENTHVLERGHPIVDSAQAGDAIVLYCVAQWPMWGTCVRRSGSHGRKTELFYYHSERVPEKQDHDQGGGGISSLVEVM